VQDQATPNTSHRYGISENATIAIIACLILADLLTGLFFNMEFGFHRVGLPLKSALIFFTFIFYLTALTQKTFQSIYLAMGILLVFWIIASFVSYKLNPDFEYGYSVIVLNRYFFFFILSCLFISLNGEHSFTRKCRILFESFFIINNVMVFAGLIFSIDMFSTYDPLGEIDDQRFGYKGLIHGGNDIAGIYIIGMAYFFREYFQYRRKKLLLLLMTCAAAFLTGTKAGMISVTLLTLYFCFRYRRNYFLIVCLLLLIVGSYFLITYRVIILDQYLEPFLQRIRSMRVLSYLMSSRNEFVINNFTYMGSNWLTINYITGDAFLSSETDILDLYFFFGLGGLLYLYFYIKIFFWKDKSLDNLYIFLVLLSIATLAGHIIQSTVTPLFVLLYIFSIRKSEEHDSPGNSGHN
jgi:hypothetical protein